MVNFNFGLGGLMGGDDDKKDASNTNPVGDNSTTQDDSAQADNSAVSADETTTPVVNQDVVAETSETSADENPANLDETTKNSEPEAATEPVFDGGDQAPADDSPFVDEPVSSESADLASSAEETPSETAETPAAENFAGNSDTTETADIGGLSTQNEEEAWLNDEAPTEPVTLDAETPAMPTFGQPTDETPAETTEEATTETAEIADTPVMPDFAPAPATEEVAETPVEAPAEAVETETAVDENPAKNEANPFPEAAVPAVEENSTEPTAPASTAPFIPAVPKAQTSILETPAEENKEEVKEESALPEIPTFGQPADETPAKTTDENPANLAETTETPAPEVPDFLSGANNDTAESSTDDLFATTDEPVAEENPLAPAPMATIGEVEETSPAETLSDEDFGLTETAENDLGGNTSQDDAQGDDDDDDDAQNLAKKMTKNPVATLEELKKGISEFVESHNSKIEEYNQQIAELKAKIREEKHILREEQKKSAKILEDLNNLVANFSQTKTIKKKAPKKVNNHKFTVKK